MKKSSKFWQSFLVAGIAALAVPTFVQGQSAGSGAAGSGMPSGSAGSSGMSSGSSGAAGAQGTAPGSGMGTPSGMTGSSGTHSGSSGTSGMTGSGTAGGMSSSPTGSMSKDMANTDADKRLNSQIRQSLNADTTLTGAGRDIQLNTQDGQVTLQGSVGSEAEKNQIEQKVKQMTNVESVRNQLRVTNNAGSSSSMSGSSGSTPSMSNPSTGSSSTGSSTR